MVVCALKQVDELASQVWLPLALQAPVLDSGRRPVA
jgi:hypothetical protein